MLRCIAICFAVPLEGRFPAMDAWGMKFCAHASCTQEHLGAFLGAHPTQWHIDVCGHVGIPGRVGIQASRFSRTYCKKRN